MLLPGDDVVGVNVFRDGELIAMVPVGTNFYVDEQLDAADYEYCITNFYESEAQSCQVCDMVTVTPGGYVNGLCNRVCHQAILLKAQQLY